MSLFIFHLLLSYGNSFALLEGNLATTGLQILKQQLVNKNIAK